MGIAETLEINQSTAMHHESEEKSKARKNWFHIKLQKGTFV